MIQRVGLVGVVVIALAGCGVQMGDSGDGAADGDEALGCEGPLGKPLSPQSIAGMTACCGDFGGAAHCLPAANVPAALRGFVATCETGGYCLPDAFLATGAAEPPQQCTAFGGAGVCLSVCIPQVSDNMALLAPDVCANADDLCVPCASPLDGTPTGACDLLELAVCVGEAPDVGPGPGGCDDPATCNYDAACPPVVDPSPLTACGADAHCVAPALIPAEYAAQLGPCTGSTDLCVPDVFLETGGKFTAPTCESVNGAEGRCLSVVLPAVAGQAALLPQDSCAAGEKCTPCYDPSSGEPTGACTLSCDLGPTEPPTTFAPCCDGRARCVPTQSIPEDQQGQLEEGDCEDIEDDAYLCVPNEILANGPFPTCSGDSFILGDYTGVCLSDCLDFGIRGIALVRGTCSNDFKCAPCEQNGEPTGAPGCP